VTAPSCALPSCAGNGLFSRAVPLRPPPVPFLAARYPPPAALEEFTAHLAGDAVPRPFLMSGLLVFMPPTPPPGFAVERKTVNTSTLPAEENQASTVPAF